MTEIVEKIVVFALAKKNLLELAEKEPELVHVEDEEDENPTQRDAASGPDGEDDGAKAKQGADYADGKSLAFLFTA